MAPHGRHRARRVSLAGLMLRRLADEARRYLRSSRPETIGRAVAHVLGLYAIGGIAWAALYFAGIAPDPRAVVAEHLADLVTATQADTATDTAP